MTVLHSAPKFTSNEGVLDALVAALGDLAAEIYRRGVSRASGRPGRSGLQGRFDQARLAPLFQHGALSRSGRRLALLNIFLLLELPHGGSVVAGGDLTGAAGDRAYDRRRQRKGKHGRAMRGGLVGVKQSCEGQGHN